MHASTSLDYEWRIPASWEFVSPDAVALTDAPTATERVAARPRGRSPSSDSLMLAVTDFVAIVPGQYHDRDPGALDELERTATEWLAAHGLAKEASKRTKFLDHDAVRVEARVGPEPRFLTLVLFYKDRRRFELRCLSRERPGDMLCADAFGRLEIREPKDSPGEAGRVLHLREDRLGVSFDAPDDGWLAFGPRLGFGGRQQVWIWVNPGRQIDVAVLELPREANAADVVASRIADQNRSQGATVTSDRSTLGDQPCAHLEIDGRLGAQDMFIYVRGTFVYSVLVTSRARDAGLLARARAGIRFAAPSVR